MSPRANWARLPLEVQALVLDRVDRPGLLAMALTGDREARERLRHWHEKVLDLREERVTDADTDVMAFLARVRGSFHASFHRLFSFVLSF